MIAILVKKQIHSSCSACSNMDIYLERTAACPFTPFPGLLFTDHSGDTFKVEEIVVDLDGDVTAYAEPDKTLYPSSLRLSDKEREEKIRKIAAEYVEAGWKLMPTIRPVKVHGLDPDWQRDVLRAAQNCPGYGGAAQCGS